mmetsp:Transcript_28395/g.65921  ORF Transcript_28395/g.65921 Transcript_28395/m.65921 type:complete len:225 (-) Transcript_28395:1044-1718(-)
MSKKTLLEEDVVDDSFLLPKADPDGIENAPAFIPEAPNVVCPEPIFFAAKPPAKMDCFVTPPGAFSSGFWLSSDPVFSPAGAVEVAFVSSRLVLSPVGTSVLAASASDPCTAAASSLSACEDFGTASVSVIFSVAATTELFASFFGSGASCFSSVPGLRLLAFSSSAFIRDSSFLFFIISFSFKARASCFFTASEEPLFFVGATGGRDCDMSCFASPEATLLLL